MKYLKILLILTFVAISLPAAEVSFLTVAADSCNLNGHNLLCDSFNSTDTNRSTDGHYDAAKAADSQLVGFASGIFNSSGSAGKASIWGYFQTKTPFTLEIGSQGSIGSTLWQVSGMTGIEPGHHTTNYDLVAPDIAPPFACCPPTGGTVDGITYKYIVRPGDTLALNELTLSGNETMGVFGSANLIVRGNVKVSGNGAIRIQPGARLNLYVAGESANISGDGIINLGGPRGFLYVGMVGNTALTWKTSRITALIYAPHAACDISSPGSDRVEIEGAIITKSLTLNADVSFHYDEALGL